MTLHDGRAVSEAAVRAVCRHAVTSCLLLGYGPQDSYHCSYTSVFIAGILLGMIGQCHDLLGLLPPNTKGKFKAFNLPYSKIYIAC